MDADRLARLTDKQRECLRLVYAHLSSKEIAHAARRRARHGRSICEGGDANRSASATGGPRRECSPIIEGYEASSSGRGSGCRTSRRPSTPNRRAASRYCRSRWRDCGRLTSDGGSGLAWIVLIAIGIALAFLALARDVRGLRANLAALGDAEPSRILYRHTDRRTCISTSSPMPLLLAGCWLYALARGGAPERIGATDIAYCLSAFTAVAISDPTARASGRSKPACWSSTCCALPLSLCSLIRAERFWPLWVCRIAVTHRCGSRREARRPGNDS